MLRILNAIGFVLVVLVSVYVGTLIGPMLGATWRSFFPAHMSWESKDAFAKCSPAIANPAGWPKAAKAACAAMTMCREEAELSAAELAALREAAKRLRDCPGF
jgi:hypothetical protein